MAALRILGKLVISLIGLSALGFAALLVWYIFWAQLLTWVAVAGALACAALFAFLGLTITLAPWRKRPTGAVS